MLVQALPAVPGNSVVFIDANIFIYGLSGRSGQCHQLLERCLREEVTGITLFETLSEVTHRLMVAEALGKGLIGRGGAKALRHNLSEPWYKVVTPREEVREGRSFNPDEFAIALEQVVSGTAPRDYSDPERFFARTCFTRALREHSGMVLRRLSGLTENTAPVLTLITQFGGGKTHTLTALYHLARSGRKAGDFEGVDTVLREAGITEVPSARVGVFVGNAWDPRPGRETPWLDLAQQLAGDMGVAALGTEARTTPPGTTAIGDLVKVAGGKVLVLCDEVLNFVNRHRKLAEPFYAFIQNLTVAMTGTTHSSAVISLPRSQVEMTDHDREWQEKITKVVRRVAKDLIANDETEISEVIRRRLFDDLGKASTRKAVAKTFADWCFERRNQLPPEWTAVDSAATEGKAREYLRTRFETCYPFHPATLSVFQRKWQALPQYQQTRGTLAMLAQWVSWAAREGFSKAHRTLDYAGLSSAPRIRVSSRGAGTTGRGAPGASHRRRCHERPQPCEGFGCGHARSST